MKVLGGGAFKGGLSRWKRTLTNGMNDLIKEDQERALVPNTM